MPPGRTAQGDGARRASEGRRSAATEQDAPAAPEPVPDLRVAKAIPAQKIRKAPSYRRAAGARMRPRIGTLAGSAHASCTNTVLILQNSRMPYSESSRP